MNGCEVLIKRNYSDTSIAAAEGRSSKRIKCDIYNYDDTQLYEDIDRIYGHIISPVLVPIRSFIDLRPDMLIFDKNRILEALFYLETHALFVSIAHLENEYYNMISQILNYKENFNHFNEINLQAQLYFNQNILTHTIYTNIPDNIRQIIVPDELEYQCSISQTRAKTRFCTATPM